MSGKWGRKKKSADTGTVPDTHVSASLDHAVVSGDITKPTKISTRTINVQGIKAWPRKKKLTVGLGALLVVVLLSVGGYLVFRNNDPDPALRDVRTTSEGVVLRQVDKKDLQTEVEKLLYQKKYSSAIELIEYQKEATKDKEIQILLATAYMEQNKHQEALTVLLSVEETFDKDWKISRNIGTEYERLGNKPEALKYYQKSLAQLKDTDDVPVKEDEVFFTEQDIKRVGG